MALTTQNDSRATSEANEFGRKPCPGLTPKKPLVFEGVTVLTYALTTTIVPD